MPGLIKQVPLWHNIMAGYERQTEFDEMRTIYNCKLLGLLLLLNGMEKIMQALKVLRWIPYCSRKKYVFAAEMKINVFKTGPKIQAIVLCG